MGFTPCIVADPSASDLQRPMGPNGHRHGGDRGPYVQQVGLLHPRDKALLTQSRSPSDFYEIMDMLDKRLNDKGKNWRHVLKSLKVLDYCLHEGSELVVTWARKNIYIIKTLREFQYVDEDGRDVGQNGMRISRTPIETMLTASSAHICQRAHFIDFG